MDNSQSFDIPIDSPLEQSMEDALVPATNPTFSYNTQSPASAFLTNSIKFEDEGVVAGWYRYKLGSRLRIEGSTNYPLPTSRIKSVVPIYSGEEVVGYRFGLDDGVEMVVGVGFVQNERGTVELIRTPGTSLVHIKATSTNGVTVSEFDYDIYSDSKVLVPYNATGDYLTPGKYNPVQLNYKSGLDWNFSLSSLGQVVPGTLTLPSSSLGTNLDPSKNSTHTPELSTYEYSVGPPGGQELGAVSADWTTNQASINIPSGQISALNSALIPGGMRVGIRNNVESTWAVELTPIVKGFGLLPGNIRSTTSWSYVDWWSEYWEVDTPAAGDRPATFKPSGLETMVNNGSSANFITITQSTAVLPGGATTGFVQNSDWRNIGFSFRLGFPEGGLLSMFRIKSGGPEIVAPSSWLPPPTAPPYNYARCIQYITGMARTQFTNIGVSAMDQSTCSTSLFTNFGTAPPNTWSDPLGVSISVNVEQTSSGLPPYLDLLINVSYEFPVSVITKVTVREETEGVEVIDYTVDTRPTVFSGSVRLQCPCLFGYWIEQIAPLVPPDWSVGYQEGFSGMFQPSPFVLRNSYAAYLNLINFEITNSTLDTTDLGTMVVQYSANNLSPTLPLLLPEHVLGFYIGPNLQIVSELTQVSPMGWDWSKSQPIKGTWTFRVRSNLISYLDLIKPVLTLEDGEFIRLAVTNGSIDTRVEFLYKNSEVVVEKTGSRFNSSGLEWVAEDISMEGSVVSFGVVSLVGNRAIISFPGIVNNFGFNWESSSFSSEVLVDWYVGTVPYWLRYSVTDSVNEVVVGAKDIRTGVETQIKCGSLQDKVIFTTAFSESIEQRKFWYLSATLMLVEYDDELVTLKAETPDTPKEGWVEVSRILKQDFMGVGDNWSQLEVPSSINWDKEAVMPVLCLSASADDPTVISIKVYEISSTGSLSSGVLSRGPYLVPIKDCTSTSLQYPKPGSITTLVLGYIQAQELLRMSDVSSFYNGATLLVGLKYTKGLNQWTIKIGPEGVQNIIHGYGSVGPTGVLTGGAIPSNRCTVNGFNPLNSVLKTPPASSPGPTTNSTNTLGEYLIGNTVYFKENTTSGIVYALELDGTSFKLKTLPLTNSVSFTISGESGDRTRSASVMQPGTIAGIYTSGKSSPGGAVGAYACAVALVSAHTFHITKQGSGNIADQRFLAMEGKASGGAYAGIKQFCGVANGLSVTIPIGSGDGGGEGAENENGWKELAQEVKAGFAEVGESVKNSAKGVIQDIKDFGSDIAGKNGSEGVVRGLSKAAGVVQGVVNAVSNYSRVRQDIESSLPKAYAVVSYVLPWTEYYHIDDSQNVGAGPGFVGLQFCEKEYLQGKLHNARGWAGTAGNFDLTIGTSAWGGGGAGFVGGGGGLTFTMIAEASDRGQGHKDEPVIQPPVHLGTRHLYVMYPVSKLQAHSLETYYSGLSYTFTPVQDLGNGLDVTNKVIDSGFYTVSGKETIVDNIGLVQGVSSYVGGGVPIGWPAVLNTGDPVFSTPGFYDYCISTGYGLYYTVVDTDVIATNVNDTVLFDGQPTNVLLFADSTMAVAGTYTACYVDRFEGLHQLDMKVLTANSLRLNKTGLNVLRELEAIHAFDAYTNRVLSFIGNAGMDKEVLNLMYSEQSDQGGFKVYNQVVPTQYFGEFLGRPLIDYSYNISIFGDWLDNKQKALENLQTRRYTIPITSQSIQKVPAYIRTKGAYKLIVVDGETSLTTELRSSSEFKFPTERDFVIYGQVYRQTADYISKVITGQGAQYAEDIVGTVGLNYIGSTSRVAWLFSPTLREFFQFGGSESINSVGTAFRFRDVQDGFWDLVAQEIVFRSTLERELKTLVRVDDGFTGMVVRPNELVGEYDYYGLSCGLVMQGKDQQTTVDDLPQRVQVNRFMLHDYMLIPGMSILENRNKWRKIRGDKLEDFFSDRVYDRNNMVSGYFIEPFKLCTAFLGLEDRSECKFEWVINFGMTDIMRKVYGDTFVQVNFAAETMTVGGTVTSEVSHCYLKKDMFARRADGNGYYTYRYHSNNGLGSEEKLYMWSDGLLAVRSITLEVVKVSERRAAPLITRPDVSGLEEM